MINRFSIGSHVRFHLEENYIGIVGMASMSFKAQIKRCTEQIGQPFGRGILLQKGMLEWKIQVIDEHNHVIHTAEDKPFVIRMLVSRDVGYPHGLTNISSDI